MYYPVWMAAVEIPQCSAYESISADDGVTEVFFDSMGADFAARTDCGLHPDPVVQPFTQ
jgi:hypothetical protein